MPLPIISIFISVSLALCLGAHAHYFISLVHVRVLAHVSLVLSFIYANTGCHGPLPHQPESIAHAHYYSQFSLILGRPAHVSLVLSFIYVKDRVPWPITLST